MYSEYSHHISTTGNATHSRAGLVTYQIVKLPKFAEINKEKQAIELISFNANGLREDRKRRSTFNWLKKTHNAEQKITLLQETHTDVNNVTAWETDWGNRNIIFAHGTNKSKGVAILLPSKIDCKVITQICDPDGRYIAVELNIDDNQIWVFNCYAPNDQVERVQWLGKIQPLLDRAGGSNIIIGGDLNDYFNPQLDKYNAKINLMETDYIKAWKATCNDLNLTEIWRTLNPNTKRYTWRQGKSSETLKQSRLDYWLISNHMIYDLNNVDIQPGFRSDHSLIDIYFQGHQDSDRGPSFWRFNANLLRNKDYIEYMNNRIDEIIDKHKDIDNLGLRWDVIKMEIRSSTICFS